MMGERRRLMDRRTFFKTVAVAGGATLLVAPESHALQFYPHQTKQKWAVLFGSRYGTTRDAGVWISEAADILAMAPETNIGSSTPIDSSGQNIGSDLRRKVVNDAAAGLPSHQAALRVIGVVVECSPRYFALEWVVWLDA